MNEEIMNLARRKCFKCSGYMRLMSWVKDDSGKVIGGYYFCDICGARKKVIY